MTVIRLTPEIIERCHWLVNSYRLWTQKDLLPNLPEDPQGIAHCLYEAPQVIVSHGVQSDPIFWFANQTAQRLWEVSWEDFIRMPSRQSVEQDEQEDRNQLLIRAKLFGFVDDYQGVRISATGKRFRIQNVLLWNIQDPHGCPAGQAATFSDWEFL